MTEYLYGALEIFAAYLVAFAIFTPLEILWRKGNLSAADRSHGLKFYAIIIPIDAAVIMLTAWAVEHAGITPLLSVHYGFGSVILASIAAALYADLLFYWFHRIQHRFLWRWHSVHHSIESLSAINSYHHWSEQLWVTLIVGGPVLLIDFRAAPLAAALSFTFRLQRYYIHSPTRIHFGPARRMLVDNHYHRVHHSLEPQHFDKNFGAMTPLWDWLFGTLYMPKSSEWPAVGIAGVKEPKTMAEWAKAPGSMPTRIGLFARARGNGY